MSKVLKILNSMLIAIMLLIFVALFAIIIIKNYSKPKGGVVDRGDFERNVVVKQRVDILKGRLSRR